MSVQSATAAGRRAALARMTSTANVRRKSGDPAQSDGYDVDQWEYVHTDIPFRLVSKGSRQVVVGGTAFQEATARADFPLPNEGEADGYMDDDDLIEITSGTWTGSVFRVIDAGAGKGDDVTAFRVPVVETERPEEWL